MQRLVQQIQINDIDGILMFDPMNIRYATDSTNMQLWNTHNPFRAVMVTADGLWCYGTTKTPNSCPTTIPEYGKSATGRICSTSTGDGVTAAAQRFAAEVAELARTRGASTGRIAVDKIMMSGLRALERTELAVLEGEPLTERARAIKSEDEIHAMRCSIHATEQSMYAMEAAAKPGMSENDIWAVLHAENIRRGGEWIETRLLSSGPRTNPWFQECGPRIVQNNEILAFDTDLVGPYGMCCDISRTWWIGDGLPEQRHKDAMKLGIEHIEHNRALLGPGVTFDELTHKAHVLPAHYQRLKYGCVYHGVGQCDEWPMIAYPDAHVPGAFDGQLEPGMVLCVEALITQDGGDFRSS